MNNWQTKKLGDITAINGGGTPPTSHAEYFDGNVPWFTPSEITSGTVSVLTDSRRQITEEATKFSKVAEQGTVLLSSRATIGNIGIVSNRSTYNQGIKGITPKEELIPWYLAYWLLANKKRLEKSSFGTTFKELSTTALKRFDITIPSISVQQQIVEKLDEIRKLQELNNKEIEKTEELFDSYLLQQFIKNKKLTTKKIGEVTESITYGLSTSVAGNLDKNGIPILTMAEVNDDGSISYPRIRIIKVGEKEKIKFLLKRGDILFNWRNASKRLIGKTVIFDSSTPTIYASFLLKITPKKELSNYYLAYYLNFLRRSNYFSNYCKEQANNTVNATELRAIEIRYPSLEEQKKIVGELFNIQKYKELLLVQRNSARDLFGSMLDKLMRPN